MKVRDLMRTLTPLGWLALAGAAVVLLSITGRGLGLRWDPFNVQQRLMPDTELIEFVCGENNTPAKRLVGH